MRRLVPAVVAAWGAVLLAGAPAASGATPAWTPSLSVSANPASIQALSLVRPGALLAVGGRNVAGAYDQPTVWRYRQGIWKEQRLPVDLTNSWGYATAVGQTAGDIWVGGWTTNQSTGAETPFVTHWQDGRWGVLTRRWLDPIDGQGGIAAIVTRGPQDVWVLVNEGGYFESLTDTAIWHFDGRLWQEGPSMPVRDKQCSAGYGLTITSAALTPTDLLVSANCTTTEFKTAGMVERFDGRSWRDVLSLPGGTAILGLAADANGSAWAVGRVTGADALARGAAWSGDGSAMARVAVPTPNQSILQSVAFDGSRVELAGESEQASGPGPLLFSGSAGGWTLEQVPYDRGLSAVAIGDNQRLWVSGPVFGGWLGGDPPHAAVLTRAG